MGVAQALWLIAALWLTFGLVSFAVFLLRAGTPRHPGWLTNGLALGLILIAFAVLGPLDLWLEWAAWRKARARFHEGSPARLAQVADDFQSESRKPGDRQDA
jgi:hypothetical protein